MASGRLMLRGDIRLVDLEPARSGEANKRHPAVLVSNDGATVVAAKLGIGVVTVVPAMTSVVKVYPFQVLLSSAETGCRADAASRRSSASSFGAVGAVLHAAIWSGWPRHSFESADPAEYRGRMTGIARFSLVAIDCRDPQALGAFYSALTGWPIEYDGGAWVMLASNTGATIAFQRAPSHEPPSWPSDEHPQQMHLDFDVPDLDNGEAQVLAIGARKAEFQPGESFRVYLDPAGHPFCLVHDPDMQ